ncbi:hypothetical protein GCM10025865_15510 [Paraoerskovia sediminicola]|uniref:Uncharacterized protein n=1 Tax=Paraoerskovia sediminicola TaxID=1138587 RepID=A0ABN6XBP7_9CELL|nr:hypothetical protein [Paraoerskovia sediminicola]BDZ42252.1 hypothetical protein GCM10025865_15510 [Paraoerskovia sediminicola]
MLPTTAEQSCTADGETACLAVLVLDGDNNRIGGAEAEVTGPENFSETVTSTEEGLPAVPTSTVGEYTVTIDESTLPDDAQLGEGAATEITVIAQLGSTARAAFRVGVDAAPTTDATDSATDSGDASTATDSGSSSPPRSAGSRSARSGSRSAPGSGSGSSSPSPRSGSASSTAPRGSRASPTVSRSPSGRCSRS